MTLYKVIPRKIPFPISLARIDEYAGRKYPPDGNSEKPYEPKHP